MKPVEDASVRKPGQRGRRWAAYTILGGGLPIAGLIATLIVVGGSDREPIYQGKSVSSWLDELRKRSFRLGPNIPAVVRQRWQNSQAKAVSALVEIGDPAIPYIVSKLNNDEKSFSAKAYETIYEAVPKFIQKYLERPRSVSKMRLVDVLGAMGGKAMEVKPLLHKEFRWGSPSERLHLAHALARIDPTDPIPTTEKPPVDYLMRRVAHGRSRDGIMFLGNIGAPAKKAIPVLSNVLADGRVAERILAAKAIGMIAKQTEERSPEAIAALRQAAKGSNRMVKAAARSALTKLGLNPPRKQATSSRRRGAQRGY